MRGVRSFRWGNLGQSRGRGGGEDASRGGDRVRGRERVKGGGLLRMNAKNFATPPPRVTHPLPITTEKFT